MKTNIKVLEEKLKKMTGADKLPYGDIPLEKKNVKPFDSGEFLKLAKEVGNMFREDEKNSNTAIR